MKGFLFLSNGLPIFSYIIDITLKINIDMISGFLSAIDQFAQGVYNSGFDSIVFGTTKLIYKRVPISHNNESSVLLIVGFAAKDATEKETNDIMTSITDSFFKLYSAENILRWNGNLLEFAPFRKIIDKTIKGEDVSNLISENLALLKDDIQREKEIFMYSISGLKSNLLGYYLDQKPGVDVEQIKTLNNEILRDLNLEMKNANGSVREVIFPLPSSTYLAYTTSFAFKSDILSNQPDDSLYCAIVYFMKNKYLEFLPKVTSEIKSNVSELKNLINSCPKCSIETIEGILKKIDDHLKSIEPLKKVSAEIQKLDTIKPLFEKNIKNLDHLIYSIIIGHPVAIIGEKHQAKTLLQDLLPFTFHRDVKISEYPEKPLDKKAIDIVLVDPQQAKHYKDCVQIYCEKYQVKNGESNKYVQKLLKELEDLKDPELMAIALRKNLNWLSSKASMIRELRMAIALRKNLNWLSSKASMIRELSRKQEVNPQDLEVIKTGLDESSEKIIVSLSAGKNSKLQNLVDKLILTIPANKLIVNKRFVQFSQKKIIAPSGLTEQEHQEYMDAIIKTATMFVGKQYVETLMHEI